MHPKTLLLVLILAVPLLVGVFGGLSFVLLRMGYGFLVWAVLPFLVSLAFVAVLGLVLGRAASRGPERRSGRGSKDDAPPRRNGV